MLRNLMICYNIHYDMVRYDVIYDVIFGDNMYAHSFIYIYLSVSF